MVYPVSGPVIKTENRVVYHPRFGFPITWGTRTRSTYRQKKPYNLSLPYGMSDRQLLTQNNFGEFYKSVSDVPVSLSETNQNLQRLYNKAYESFMGNVRSAQADVMTLMRERQKTLSMIENRGLQFAVFLNAARKRNIGQMRAVLRQAYGNDARSGTKVGWRRNVRSAGGNVLEYSFGWAPLASDLSSAVEVFRKGPPSGICKGHARQTFQENYQTGGDPDSYVVLNEQIGWLLRAQVRCVDSDIYLLNSLGLINLASSVWETTPWSFVVDYFVNVQTFLNSFTDRLGLEFENASSTSFRVTNSTVTYSSGYPPPPGGWPNYTGRSVSVDRVTGISRPTLAWRAPWSLSPQRALTSIALLLQRFKD